MYKRMVIYLGYYKYNQRKKNCGYIKMNLLGDSCKLDIHIMDLPEMEGEQWICLLGKRQRPYKDGKNCERRVKSGSYAVKI